MGKHIVSGEDVPTMTFPLQRGAKFCRHRDRPWGLWLEEVGLYIYIMDISIYIHNHHGYIMILSDISNYIQLGFEPALNWGEVVFAFFVLHPKLKWNDCQLGHRQKVPEELPIEPPAPLPFYEAYPLSCSYGAGAHQWHPDDPPGTVGCQGGPANNPSLIFDTPMVWFQIRVNL